MRVGKLVSDKDICSVVVRDRSCWVWCFRDSSSLRHASSSSSFSLRSLSASSLFDISSFHFASESSASFFNFSF